MNIATVEVRRCPECGDREHLYGRADVRWSHEAHDWIAGDLEDEVECTECDWSGSMAETLFKGLDNDHCGQCEGTGTTQSASNGQSEPCPVCDGAGTIGDDAEPCPINRRPKDTCPASCNHGED